MGGLMLRRRALLNGIRVAEASGPLVTFKGVSAPLKKLNVNIEPVQDLHGYDNPWPAGGGKNLLPPTLYSGGTYNPTVGDTFTLAESQKQFTTTDNKVFTLTTTSTWEYYTMFFPVTQQKYRLSGEIKSSETLGVSKCYLDQDYKVLYVSSSTSTPQSIEATWNADTALEGAARFIAIIFSNRSTASTTITVTNPMAETGTTTTAYAPYENICPISGFTETNVYHTLENIYTNTGIGPTGAVTPSSVITILSPTSIHVERNNGKYASSKQPLSNYDLTVGSTYKVRAYAEVASGTAMLAIRNSSDVIQAGTDGITTNGYLEFSFTYDGTDTNYLSFFCGFNQNSGDVTYSDISFREVDALTVEWEDEAGTVYGGTLDVVSGVLTVTHISRTLNSITLSYNSSAHRFESASWTSVWRTAGEITILSEAYKSITNRTGGSFNADAPDFSICFNTSSNYFVFKDSRYTDVTALKTDVGDTSVVLKLYNPTIYQLTPPELFRALNGINNIWADAGDVDVKYLTH